MRKDSKKGSAVQGKAALVVSVLVNMRYAICRDIVEGVRRYATARGDWFIHLHDASDVGLQWVNKVNPDGLIAHVGTETFRRALSELRVPLVNTSTALREPLRPLVGLDNRRIGQMAAEHFIDKGLHDLVVPRKGWTLAEERAAGFIGATQAAGCRIHLVSPDYENARDPEARATRLLELIRSLPSPLGWFEVNDVDAINLSYLCHMAGIAVPDEVALLGVDNDESICRGTVPMISSINVPGKEIGYRAAELLDRFLHGETTAAAFSNHEERLKPIDVMQRGSTDFQNYADPLLKRAIRLMRERATMGANVADLLQELGCSRSALEKAFRREIKHTPLYHLNLIRCQRARELLKDNALTLEAVAEKSGFNDTVTFWSVFKKHTGESPGAFRKLSRE
jgi:LacI family transcriptional regulator